MDGEAAYTLGEVRRLAGLPESFIATLVELGVLEPLDGQRFSHQDLVVLRTARALRDAEVPARKVVQALRNVKAGLASTHLASVRLRARGGAIEASAGPRRFDALSGQMLLPFDDAAAGAGVQALGRPAAAVAQALAAALAAEAHDDAAAEAAYRRALEQDAACALAYVNLGALLSEAGRHEEALSLYDQALVWCEASPLVHYNRAIALEDTGQPRQAAAAYERALQLDARLADAHYNLGLLLERLGDAQGSLRHFSAYRRLAPP
ncbi:tetratricopeptide repeat protein [Pelomonas sp. P7]|uniref:Tetratricopeptide repeat protein n=1 Tax=Pelomonas caseinilytica TaxID=2906763 RepID=A0ABS8XCK0_9BURK|nr:tetratricopeptide repeat protein [Pelomonas sp. P7]MCE4538661.1 tetratricopeptide repeat protein [Pelomonas sp. P7]